MIRKLIPLLVPAVALVGGAIGGEALRGPADPATEAAAHGEVPHGDAAKGDGHEEGQPEAFFSFPSQFFVPLVRQGDLRDVMVLTLTLQTDAESAEAMKAREHALRDALLRQLLIHANTGGFDGNFTAEHTLTPLREALLEAAQATAQLPVTAVLIEDIARQSG